MCLINKNYTVHCASWSCGSAAEQFEGTMLKIVPKLCGFTT